MRKKWECETLCITLNGNASVGKVITSKDIAMVNSISATVSQHLLHQGMHLKHSVSMRTKPILIWLHLLMWFEEVFPNKELISHLFAGNHVTSNVYPQHHRNPLNGRKKMEQPLQQHRTIFIQNALSWVKLSFQTSYSSQSVRKWINNLFHGLVEFLIRIHVSYFIVNYFDCFIYWSMAFASRISNGKH